jgi:hypothetical protein
MRYASLPRACHACSRPPAAARHTTSRPGRARITSPAASMNPSSLASLAGLAPNSSTCKFYADQALTGIHSNAGSTTTLVCHVPYSNLDRDRSYLKGRAGAIADCIQETCHRFCTNAIAAQVQLTQRWPAIVCQLHRRIITAAGTAGPASKQRQLLQVAQGCKRRDDCAVRCRRHL